jgi:hypothetical protein
MFLFWLTVDSTLLSVDKGQETLLARQTDRQTNQFQNIRPYPLCLFSFSTNCGTFLNSIHRDQQDGEAMRSFQLLQLPTHQQNRIFWLSQERGSVRDFELLPSDF